jgi:hypothetical protein
MLASFYEVGLGCFDFGYMKFHIYGVSCIHIDAVSKSQAGSKRDGRACGGNSAALKSPAVESD